MRFQQTADWFARRRPKTEPTIIVEDELSSYVTTKLWTFAEGTGEHEAVEEEDLRLELDDDAELTMQLRAIKGGRKLLLAAIGAAVLALGSGIALVL